MNYLLNKYNELINADFMIRHTNAWYGDLAGEYTPRQDEVRDMFSSGQVLSKFWMIERLERVNARISKPFETVLVVGGWYGNLSYYLYKTFPDAHIHNLDIDPRCAKYVNSVYSDLYHIKGITKDMYDFDYKSQPYDLVVNTSMEHIPDQKAWLDMLPKGQLVALQSNDFTSCDQHINCSPNLQHFRNQVQLSGIEEIGESEFPMYSRYMIIGTT